MKAEDIDLEKEQVFETPIEGFEFSTSEFFDGSTHRSLKAVMDIEGQWDYFDTKGGRWPYCRPTQTPQPKTRPMAHFEVLKLDAVFKHNQSHVICNNWFSSMSIENHTYCLRSDFQKAETPEDVVWKKLEVEA